MEQGGNNDRKQNNYLETLNVQYSLLLLATMLPVSSSQVAYSLRRLYHQISSSQFPLQKTRLRVTRIEIAVRIFTDLRNKNQRLQLINLTHPRAKLCTSIQLTVNQILKEILCRGICQERIIIYKRKIFISPPSSILHYSIHVT